MRHSTICQIVGKILKFNKDDLVNSQASAWSIGLCGSQVEKRQWSVRFLISGLVFTKFVLEKVVGQVPDHCFVFTNTF